MFIYNSIEYVEKVYTKNTFNCQIKKTDKTQGEKIFMDKNKNKKIGKLGFALLIAVALIAVVFSGCVETGETTVKVTGSSTVLPMASACAEEFNSRHDNVKVTVTGGGSGHGINAVASEQADIGDASRPAKASDVEDISGVTLDNLIDHKIAADGVAIIVSKTVYEAGVTNLTSQQVKDIYMGNINNWNELGGPNSEIDVNERQEGSGTRDTFMEALGLEETPGADNAHKSNSLAKTAVKNADNGIAYVGLGYVGTDTPAVKLDGVEPTDANIKSGDYPITRSLHMYTLGKAKGEVLDFLNFVRSPEGQEIVANEGFIKMYE